MLKERFRIKKSGEFFKIVQHTEDIRDAKFLLNIHNEITKKIELTQGQIDNLPRQKEMLERDLKTLKKRLNAFRPYIKDIKKIVERERKEQEKKLKKLEQSKTK